MRRMYSEKQIKKLVEESPAEIKKALKNEDLEVQGLTAHGIANTGNFGTIGNAVVSGNMYIQEDEDGSGNLEVEGEIIGGGLNERFVKIMSAPTSTTLTDEQVSQILEGVFINGDFLSYHNPVLFPPMFEGARYYGLGIGKSSSNRGEIFAYNIHGSTKEIGISSHVLQYTGNGTVLAGILSLNGKNIPAYPSNTGTYVLKCVDGTLTWVAE